MRSVNKIPTGGQTEEKLLQNTETISLQWERDFQAELRVCEPTDLCREQAPLGCLHPGICSWNDAWASTWPLPHPITTPATDDVKCSSFPLAIPVREMWAFSVLTYRNNLLLFFFSDRKEIFLLSVSHISRNILSQGRAV